MSKKYSIQYRYSISAKKQNLVIIKIIWLILGLYQTKALISVLRGFIVLASRIVPSNLLFSLIFRIYLRNFSRFANFGLSDQWLVFESVHLPKSLKPIF